MWFLYLALGVGFIALIIWLAKKWQEKEDEKQKKANNYYRKSTTSIIRTRIYENHCWNCYTHIDSRVDKMCPKCGKYYICSKCGKCRCDNPLYSNDTNNKQTSNSTIADYKVTPNTSTTTQYKSSVFFNENSNLNHESSTIEEFYLEIRMVEFLLGCALDGQIQFSPIVKQQAQDYIRVVEKMQKYAKADYSLELLKELKNETEDFFNSMHISLLDTVQYNEAKLADILFGIRFYLRVGIDVDALERLTYDAEFEMVMKEAFK